jgi:hypothetical protein
MTTFRCFASTLCFEKYGISSVRETKRFHTVLLPVSAAQNVITMRPRLHLVAPPQETAKPIEFPKSARRAVARKNFAKRTKPFLFTEEVPQRKKKLAATS